MFGKSYERSQQRKRIFKSITVRPCFSSRGFLRTFMINKDLEDICKHNELLYSIKPKSIFSVHKSKERYLYMSWLILKNFNLAMTKNWAQYFKKEHKYNIHVALFRKKSYFWEHLMIPKWYLMKLGCIFVNHVK